MSNLESSNYGIYFTEHMRNVIETGAEYTKNHFLSIFKTLSANEINYEQCVDCVWVLRIIIPMLGFSDFELE